MPMHRAYADWAYSMEFFNRRLYRAMGFETCEALLQDWERDPLSWNANDLLSMSGHGSMRSASTASITAICPRRSTP